MSRKRSSKIRTAFLSLLLVSAGGCSSISLPSLPWSTHSQPSATAEALFAEGMQLLKNKSYVSAIDRFQRVKTEFPFSPQLVPAELKLAEAYYLNQQYPEAVSAFKEFQTLHPTNENIPFVVYHLGLSHFDQFAGVDRDQKVTEIAKGYFETVAKNYPKSPYAGPANEKLAKCREYLAEHEFYIASFYVREQKYPAARDRLERILRSYPDSPTAVKSLYHLGESYRLEKNGVKAALAYEALLQHYPESPFSKEARIQLAAVEKEKQDPLRLLLMRDGRPGSAPPPESGEAVVQNSQEPKLIAKKDVVYEEPGRQKGIFRRVLDTLNPFSSSDNRENGGQRAEAGNRSAAAKENPRGEGAQDPQLLGRIDESLKQKGVGGSPQTAASKPPAINLPEEIAQPTPADTSALLGDVDAALGKRGKKTNDSPPVPEIAPVLKTPAPEVSTPTAAKRESPSSQPVTNLIGNIDEALKKKGIEPANIDTAKPSTEPAPEAQQSTRQPAATNQPTIQLETKLTPGKGPLLESGEYQVPESPAQGDQEKTQEPTGRPDATRELPGSVVKPAPAREKVAETPQAKKSPEEEEENKGIFDQLKDDFGRLRGLLNPFAW